MAEDKPIPAPSEENVSMPIDPDEAAAALKEVNEAMAILPKRRFGCLGRYAKYGGVLFVLLAAFVYWNFLRTPGLVISKETTYITEPLTADGTRVDYFAALEKVLYPPEMKTDDNGYRLIVRALGDAANQWQEDESNGDTEARSDQVYQKLGLDPDVKPTMTFGETSEFLREYCATKGLSEKQADELDRKVFRPWTLDDLPMMEPWLEKNGPVLDLVGEAVRRPAFCFPLVQPREEAMLVEIIALGEIQRVREFARMLQARANYRIGTGNIDGAIDDLITCGRLGRHVECQGAVIARLVGIALEGIAASVGVAAVHESQPTEEQLQRLVDELDAIPPRPSMDRTWLVERYYTLDMLQAFAVGDESLAELFSALEGYEQFEPAVAPYVSVDWNIVMRRVNGLYDEMDGIQALQPPKVLSPGNLFIGVRSRRVGDATALLCTPSFQAVREANRRLDCVGNLRRITLAMLIYERQHGALPPAYTVDAAGNPLHSWRVLLLPYLGEKTLYDRIRLNEPWNSEHNRRFHDLAPAIYQCPSTQLTSGQTTYSVVVGESSAFQAAKGKPLGDLGMNLILVIEREQSIGWMEPASEMAEVVAREGINRIDEASRRIGHGIGSPHPGGLDVGFRDGGVQFIAETIESGLLKGLLDGTTEEWVY